MFHIFEMTRPSIELTTLPAKTLCVVQNFQSFLWCTFTFRSGRRFVFVDFSFFFLLNNAIIEISQPRDIQHATWNGVSLQESLQMQPERTETDRTSPHITVTVQEFITSNSIANKSLQERKILTWSKHS